MSWKSGILTSGIGDEARGGVERHRSLAEEEIDRRFLPFESSDLHRAGAVETVIEDEPSEQQTACVTAGFGDGGALGCHQYRGRCVVEGSGCESAEALVLRLSGHLRREVEGACQRVVQAGSEGLWDARRVVQTLAEYLGEGGVGADLAARSPERGGVPDVA